MTFQLAFWLLPILVTGTLMAGDSSVQIEPVAPQLTSYVTLRPAMFDSELASLVTPQVLSEITPMLPFSVIVKNISGEALRGVNIVFTEGPKHYSFASINLDSGRPAQFVPNQSKFFAPHNLIHTGAALGKINLPAQASVATIAGTYGQTPISASVELVVTAAGRFIGPDKLHVFEQQQEQKRARMTIVHELATASDPSVALAALLARSPQKVEHDIFTPSDRYGMWLRKDIRELQRSLETGIQGELERYEARVAQEISISR
jgi:hypothetical protein